MQRIDDTEGESWLKALVYGTPGKGKSSFGVSAPQPLILLSQRQGLLHIKHAAKRQGRPVPPVLLMQTAQDYRNALRSLRTIEAQRAVVEPGEVPDFVLRDQAGAELVRIPKYTPQTVVIDDFTDVVKFFGDEINRQSPPKDGKDGLPVMSERYWGVLIDRTEKVIRAFRDLPMHVIFLALLDDRTEGEGDEAERVVGPSAGTRKMPGTLAAAVNVVGVTYRTGKRIADSDQIHYEYGVMTCGPSYYLLKPYRPLRDYEVPDFSSWVERLAGDATETPAPVPATDAAVQGDAGQPAGAGVAGAPTPQEVAGPQQRRRRRGGQVPPKTKPAAETPADVADGAAAGGAS